MSNSVKIEQATRAALRRWQDEGEQADCQAILAALSAEVFSVDLKGGFAGSPLGEPYVAAAARLVRERPFRDRLRLDDDELPSMSLVRSGDTIQGVWLSAWLYISSAEAYA